MRCFEILQYITERRKKKQLNNNMRCFEIWEYDDEDNLIGMVKQ